MAETLSLTNIHGEAKTFTKDELCNTLLAMPERVTFQVILKDRYHDAIVGAFRGRTGPVRFKQIYSAICLALGATPEEAEKGFAPCPYTGQLKNHEGLIRSWIEERSPHSRQYYFKAGKRTKWREGQRPLLFINPFLGEANNRVNWMPYHHVRGAGWSFDPTAALNWPRPSEEVLNNASAAYRKQGMRGGSERTAAVKNIVAVAVKIQ